MMTVVAGVLMALGLAAEGSGAGVTIQASFRDPARRPTALFIEFTNPSPHSITITGLGQVELAGSGERDVYWGPFALDRFGPIEANARTSMTLGPGERRRVVIDLRDLLWSPSILSVWPSTSFARAVPEGSYDVKVELTGPQGGLAASPSTRATFTVVTGAAPGRSPQE